jgi:hypothetical protein
MGLPGDWGGVGAKSVFSRLISDRRWTRGLDFEAGETAPDGEKQSTDVMTINRPDDLGDIADLGLTLVEGRAVSRQRPRIPAA